MDDSTKISIKFTHNKLPWVIGGVALAIYLVTLNRWVSITGLQWMTQASNWDLWPGAHAPLDYLLTRVVGILPESGRILVYNGLTAVFGSLVLIQLARSIALLPHDRTREQRSRQRNEFAFLTIKWCWIPPIIACTACGLQITFWEHSVSATGEMLNLLLFAYSIRCLLEYRILHQESWLYHMAFVYGLAITSNYAMIGFFPCFLIALVWIKGASFFNFNFMLRMIGIGTTGLLAYLIVPIALHWFGNAPGTFWQVMATYLGSQKSALLDFPRYLTLIASLTAILPILLIGIRWPSSLGDTNAVGTAITQMMYHMLHGLFLTACLLVAFDPTLGGNGFSPRALTQGLVPFMTFYYLGALCTGYFIGYFLLVFSKPPGKSKRRPGPLHELGAKIIPALMLILLLAVPAGLLARNFAQIQADNVPVMKEYAEEFAASLPDSNNIILSDDPTTLRLLQAVLNSQSKEKADQNILISSWLMESPIYHGLVKERFPNRWIELGAKNEALANLDRGLLPGILKLLIKNNRIFYMNPSFGYYFEFFYLKPKGVLYELTLLPDGENLAPHLTEEEIDENHVFWASKKDTFDAIKRLNEMDRSNGQTIGTYYSRAMNYFGVLLQRLNLLEDAQPYFSDALELNPSNSAAEVNLAVNRKLQAGESITATAGLEINELLDQYSTPEEAMIFLGPFDDPKMCWHLSEIFRGNGQNIQASQQLERVRDLDPENSIALLVLADIYLKFQLNNPAEKLEGILSLLKIQAAAAVGDRVLQLRTVQLEAHTLSKLKKNDEAEIFLRGKLDQFGNDRTLAVSLAKILMDTQKWKEALKIINSLLDNNPDDPELLLYKGAVCIETSDFEAAISSQTHLMEVTSKKTMTHLYALMNRAIANMKNNRLDAAKSDYETLSESVQNSHKISYGLAQIAYLQKDREAAINHYQDYLSTAPITITESEEYKQVQSRFDSLKQGAEIP